MIEIIDISDVMEHIQGLKAIIFDMDDTLYGEKEYVRSGYRQIARILPQVEDAEEKLWRFFEEKKPAIDELLISESLNTEEKKQECLNVYRYQKPEIHLYAGVERILRDLKVAGYFVGVITDGRPEGQRAKIEALGLEKLVDHIIVTDELGGIEFRKPNPQAFQMMKEEAGVEYSEMCYIGDNIRKDFVAPQQLGMRCIWFRNKDGLYATN